MRKRRPAAMMDTAASGVDPAVGAYVADLNRRYGKYLRSPAETRRMLDAEMGDVTLTDLLKKEREVRP